MNGASTAAALDCAASALLLIGRGDPFRLSATLRLTCLWAVEQLEARGARPQSPAGSVDLDGLAMALDDASRAVAALPAQLQHDIAPTVAVLRGELSHLG